MCYTHHYIYCDVRSDNSHRKQNTFRGFCNLVDRFHYNTYFDSANLHRKNIRLYVLFPNMCVIWLHVFLNVAYDIYMNIRIYKFFWNNYYSYSFLFLNSNGP